MNNRESFQKTSAPRKRARVCKYSTHRVNGVSFMRDANASGRKEFSHTGRGVGWVGSPSRQGEGVHWFKLKVVKTSSCVCVPPQPEWYLTQALIWMGSSAAFMEEKIQPVFDRAGAAISARVRSSPNRDTFMKMLLLSSVSEMIQLEQSKLLQEQ